MDPWETEAEARAWLWAVLAALALLAVTLCTACAPTKRLALGGATATASVAEPLDAFDALE